MTRTHAWTPERVETLRSLWTEGQSCSQIAKALGQGCTRNAVIGKIHRLDLPERLTVARTVRAYTGPKAPRLSRTPSARPARPAPHPEPDPPTPAVIAVAPSLSVSLVALTAGACRWPDADGPGFCGHPVTPGAPYCAGHCAAAYTKPPPAALRARTWPRASGDRSMTQLRAPKDMRPAHRAPIVVRVTCEGCQFLPKLRPRCLNEASPHFRTHRESYHDRCAHFEAPGWKREGER